MFHATHYTNHLTVVWANHRPVLGPEGIYRAGAQATSVGLRDTVFHVPHDLA